MRIPFHRWHNLTIARRAAHRARIFPWRIPRPKVELVRIDAARADLISRGAEVSGIFHLAGGRVPGPDPEGRSYQTYASFSDPDGNGWLLQEITTRLPGRTWED
jgi:hypothetical protein